MGRLELPRFSFSVKQSRDRGPITPGPLSADGFGDWLHRVSPRWQWEWPHLVYAREQIIEALRKPNARIMLFWPPQHGKSELVTVRLPVYWLEQDPRRRVGIGAYSQNYANTMSRKARRVALERLDLDRGQLGKTGVEEWATVQGGTFKAVGVGAGITGNPLDGFIIDDPIKDRPQAESQVYRDRCWEWYTDAVLTRLQEGAPLILILTRWHEDDLAGRILQSESGSNWTVVKLPALAEADDPLGRAEGEPLCPARFSLEYLLGRRAELGAYSFGSLYQQRPSPAEGGVIKRAWLQYYTELPKTFDKLIMSWDMSFKDRTDSDWVVGQVWGVVGADFYLVTQVRGHWDFPETVKQVLSLIERYPTAAPRLIEDKANGTAVIQSLRRKVNRLVAVTPRESKQARLEAVSDFFEAGNVWLPQNAPWIEDYVEELAAFPNAAHDDQADSTSQALARFLHKPRKKLVPEIEPEVGPRVIIDKPNTAKTPNIDDVFSIQMGV